MKFALLAAAAAALLAGAASAASPDFAVINVDASHPVGVLKALRGVNGVPDMGFAGPDLFKGPRARPVDVSAGYRQAQVNAVRTHDSDGAGDIDPNAGALKPLGGGPGMGGSASSDAMVIFPNPAADPADPKSYNFGPADRMIGGITAIHAEVIYRLGRGGGTTAEPPTDLAKYGEIIRHIVLHYNKGWANGFHDRVKYWEVWNEPDLDHIFWRGTPEQYYGVYAAASKAIKAADPRAWVGGPTIAVVNAPSPYREGFLDFVRAHKLPLDFFTWHYYSVDSNDPQDFVRISRSMRRLLDERGFTHTLSLLDEWNYGLGDTRTASPAHLAAFVASSVIYMQDAPIDQEALYRADRSFGADGNTPDKVGQALVALGRMSPTDARLRVAGADLNGLAVEAGRSRDGGLVQVLISNYQIPDVDIGPRKGPDVMHVPNLFDLTLLPRRTVSYGHNRGYALTIKGLPAHGRYVVERYRLSQTQDFALLDSTRGRGPVIHVGGDLPPPAVELIVVRRSH
jgi:xylan 1,4-beta-xylosidase